MKISYTKDRQNKEKEIIAYEKEDIDKLVSFMI